jgi:hypothetical protein
MISKILLTGLATFFISGGIISMTAPCDEQENATVETIEHISKAIEYNGEIIPLIELPTVEITAPRNTDDLVDAIIVDGEVFPSILLDEVVITPGA